MLNSATFRGSGILERLGMDAVDLVVFDMALVASDLRSLKSSSRSKGLHGPPLLPRCRRGRGAACGSSMVDASDHRHQGYQDLF